MVRQIGISSMYQYRAATKFVTVLIFVALEPETYVFRRKVCMGSLRTLHILFSRRLFCRLYTHFIWIKPYCVHDISGTSLSRGQVLSFQ